MYNLTGKKLIVALMLAVCMFAFGCHHGDNPERSYGFVSTYFGESDCLDGYWMLERDGERWFVLDSEMPDTPARREWRQNGRPNDGVGIDVPSTDLYHGGLTVPTVRVGLTTDLLAIMTYSELLDVALPDEWFDANGNCIKPADEPPTPNCPKFPEWPDWPEWPEWPDWPEFPREPNSCLECHTGHPIPYPDPEPEPDPDDECEEDDNKGHGNDCDRDDDDNPGRGRK